MKNYISGKFNLKSYETSLRNEILAGITAFFATAYIIVVNASILSDSGISLYGAAISTAIACAFSCILIGMYSNSPLIIITGMGENIFFSYTVILSLGLTWQEGMGVVFVSGVIFTLITFTPFPKVLVRSIPASLKNSIIVGIGFFVTFIGLQKGRIIVGNENSLVSLGNLSDTSVLLTLGTLFLVVILHYYKVQGGFLISIIISTISSLLLGLTKIDFSFNIFDQAGDYLPLLAAFSFSDFISINFWIAVLSLTLMIVFQNLGAIQGLQSDNERFDRTYQASGISNIFAGLIGTSSTVVAVESAVGIAAGAKTGLSSVVTGIGFVFSLAFLPFIGVVPDSAIAPLLIIVGSFMLSNIKNIDFSDMTEYFPSFLIIILTPLTFNIADGMAFGFISYPILKVLSGKARELNVTMVIIGMLFLVNYILLLLI